MSRIQKSILLACAMIAIALLAVLGIVPEKFAQFAPIALVALFPSVVFGKARCGKSCA